MISRAKISTPHLLAALVVLLAGVFGSRFLAVQEQNPWYDTQVAAARRMQQAEAVLLKYVKTNNIPIEAEDINQTGLLGPEWTMITTSLGLLEAKRTSLSPDFAALLTGFFHEAGLQKGDAIAVGASGSFPGLGLATVCAATQMGLEARVIASFGSSMYGATRPELTFPKMLSILAEEGLVEYNLIAVSPGGDDDQGIGPLYDETPEIIMGLVEAAGVPIIKESKLADSIQKRLIAFGGDIKLFVNVGGASANMGETGAGVEFPNGLVMNPPPIPDSPIRGLIFEYAARQIPVIHLLNIRGLAHDHGMLFDPVPLPEPGHSGLYYRTANNMPVLWAGVAGALGMLIWGVRQKAKQNRTLQTRNQEVSP